MWTRYTCSKKFAAEEREDEEQTSRGQSGYREHKVTFFQIYD
jgi:hypothetical protein